MNILLFLWVIITMISSS